MVFLMQYILPIYKFLKIYYFLHIIRYSDTALRDTYAYFLFPRIILVVQK